MTPMAILGPVERSELLVEVLVAEGEAAPVFVVVAAASTMVGVMVSLEFEAEAVDLVVMTRFWMVGRGAAGATSQPLELDGQECSL